jgi:hypothetical protein
MAPKAKPFPTEAALCAAFLAAVDKRSWTPYPETEGWDILLVRKADGLQIGIQAKLRFNTHVISQALEGGYSSSLKRPGPDCRAVLVPEDEIQRHLRTICDYIGITVIKMRAAGAHWREIDFKHNARFTPDLPDRGDSWRREQWHELAPVKRCTLPDYVPDVAAGVPSPLQLTDWKIKALRLSVLLEERGHVTRLDFAHLDLDHRRWITLGWLRIENGRFVPGEAPPNFKTQHPIVYEKIKAEAKWRPPVQKEIA